MDIAKLLDGNNWIFLNLNLVKELGLQEAAILSYLVTRYNYYKKEDRLYEGSAFYAKREDIETWCGVNERTQRQIFKEFKRLNIIDWMDKDLPLKRYYVLNFNEIESIISKSETTQVKQKSPYNKYTSSDDPI